MDEQCLLKFEFEKQKMTQMITTAKNISLKMSKETSQKLKMANSKKRIKRVVNRTIDASFSDYA
jgi:hypothetical protein